MPVPSCRQLLVANAAAPSLRRRSRPEHNRPLGTAMALLTGAIWLVCYAAGLGTWASAGISFAIGFALYRGWEEPLAKEPAGVYQHSDGRPLLGRKLKGKSVQEMKDLGLLAEDADAPPCWGLAGQGCRGMSEDTEREGRIGEARWPGMGAVLALGPPHRFAHPDDWTIRGERPTEPEQRRGTESPATGLVVGALVLGRPISPGSTQLSSWWDDARSRSDWFNRADCQRFRSGMGAPGRRRQGVVSDARRRGR
jgi:hypothetical protein